MINNPENPKVSIVIPVFNGGNFLSQAIDSALAQTYRNIEILVINDGSDDDGETERIALSYGDRIRYYRKSNGGVASALNLAIKKMSGEYFSWLSHDDLYFHDKIECQIDALSSISSIERVRTIIYSDFCVFSNDPGQTTPVLMRGVPSEEFRYWLAMENKLHGCTLLIPKSAFVEIGEFNEALRTTQDYDLWFRLAINYRFVHLSGPLIKARSHPDQGSIKLAGLALTECNTLLSGFINKLNHDELLHPSPHVLSVAYARLASSMWYRGFLKAGRLGMHLSLKSFSQCSSRSNFLAISIIAKGIFKYHFIKPIRRFLPHHTRHVIRSLISRQKLDVTRCPDSLRNMEIKQKFSEIYDKNIFGGGVSRSGEGSDLSQTAIIRRQIPKILQELDIKIFLDAPCGDWYWMRKVDLPVESYIGIDIVDTIVEKNRNSFGNSKVSFQCKDLSNDDLPKSDLIFSRDCLVHLSFDDALKIISNFKRSGAKYLLTTTFTDRIKNDDLDDGFWRPLNMQLAPFNFPNPIYFINENCTEGNNLFTDKCLGLWLL